MELKIAKLNEHKYKKYGCRNYLHNDPNTYLTIKYRRNIRSEMIKGYMEMLTKQIN